MRGPRDNCTSSDIMWSLSVISNAGLWISFLLDFSLGLSNSLSKPPGEGLWVECRVGIPKSVYCSMSPNNGRYIKYRESNTKMQIAD